MVDQVSAVVSALRVALGEAERSQDTWWKVRNANRWIDQLPGALFGRWRHLKISGDSIGDVKRLEFVGHVRATIAYLVANQELVRSRRLFSWSIAKLWTARKAPPIDTEFEEVPPSEAKRLPKPSKAMRIVK